MGAFRGGVDAAMIGAPAGMRGRDAGAVPLFRRVGLVICHVVEACNLACRYCSAAAPACGAAPELMSEGTMTRAAEFLFGRTQRRCISWIFFGGEPLLAPLDWFRRAYDRLNAVAEDRGVRLRYGMQTNGTLIDEAVADFCAQIGMRPSISLDGPPHVHNLLRGGAEETVAGIRRLVARNLAPAVLVVLGPHVVGRIDEVVDYLVSLGVRRMKFNLYQTAGRARELDVVDPEMLARARFRLVERMLASDEFHDDITARLLHLAVWPGGRRPDDFRGCGAPHCGGGLRHVAVAPDGRVYPCDRCQTEGLCELGNVYAAWDEAQMHARLLRFHQENEPSARCAVCPAVRTCHMSCTAYRRSGADEAVLCQAHRWLWTRLMEIRDSVAAWVRTHPLEQGGRGPRQQVGAARQTARNRCKLNGSSVLEW